MWSTLIFVCLFFTVTGQAQKKKPNKSSNVSDVSFPGKTDIGVRTRISLSEPSVEKAIPDTKDVDVCGKIGDSICENISTYPKELIRKLLQQKKIDKDAFGNDTVIGSDTMIRLGDRFENPCRAKEDRIYPKAAMTEAKEWKYIVQGNEIGEYDYTQGIRIEICEEEGKLRNLPSRIAVPESNNGEEFQCVQQYIYRKLPAILNSTEIHFDKFKIPSCCAVMIRIKQSPV